jgi:hypothetical protein
LDKDMLDLHNKITVTGLLPKDRYLLSISFTRLQTFPHSRKVEWLQQANLALTEGKKTALSLSNHTYIHATGIT